MVPKAVLIRAAIAGLIAIISSSISWRATPGRRSRRLKVIETEALLSDRPFLRIVTTLRSLCILVQLRTLAAPQAASS